MPNLQRQLSTYTLLIALANAAATRGEAVETSDWSEGVDGVRARLVLRYSHVFNGTGIVNVYLETMNVGAQAVPLHIRIRRSDLEFRVVDLSGKVLPVDPLPCRASSWAADAFDVELPPGSSDRVKLGPWGSGVPKDRSAFVDLGFRTHWGLPTDGKDYYLKGSLELASNQDKDAQISPRYRIELPPVLIPTERKPIEPAQLASHIDELGSWMFTRDEHVSQDAVDALSKINDPRVIPWCHRAFQNRPLACKS